MFISKPTISISSVSTCCRYLTLYHSLSFQPSVSWSNLKCFFEIQGMLRADKSHPAMRPVQSSFYSRVASRPMSGWIRKSGAPVPYLFIGMDIDTPGSPSSSMWSSAARVYQLVLPPRMGSFFTAPREKKQENTISLRHVWDLHKVARLFMHTWTLTHVQTAAMERRRCLSNSAS